LVKVPALAYIARVDWRKSVQLRVLIGLLLLGLFWLVLVTVSRHWLSHRQESAALPQRAETLASAYGESVALSLWRFDEPQARRLLGGIQRAQDVREVWITSNSEAGEARVWIRDGESRTPDNDPSFAFALVNPDDAHEVIGKLHIRFDWNEIRSRIQRQVFELGLAQLLSVLALSLTTLWVLRRLLIKDLQRLSTRVSCFDPMDASASFNIRAESPPRGDEIDQVVAALEQMRGELQESYQALAADVQARTLAEEKAAYQARHDGLTGLPNRLALEEELIVRIASLQGRVGAIAFVDVDHFKILNDARGHAFGDAVLVAFARAMHARLQPSEMVARFGGDEFVVLLDLQAEQPVLEAAQAAAERLRRLAAQPISVHGQALTLGFSVGVALYPLHGADIDTLIGNADAAMYQAKQDGRNCARVFSEAMRAAVERHHVLETAVREALEKNQFSIALQPLFHASDQSLMGAEALIRWEHPSLGVMAPSDFIPVCEQSGLIREVGDTVLHLALAQLARWQQEKRWPESAVLGINISMRQLTALGFSEHLLQTLQQYGIAPRQIWLELTESVMMFDVDATSAIMHRLNDAGLRFAIDDFGTGFSSLAYLSRLPASGLKIDRSFISDIGSQRGGEAIVEAIISMAQHLNLSVVGEGVERPEQLAFLKQRGCRGIQGYLLGRPVPAEAFAASYLTHSV
jgi:diguanylate cyclase (GGDEF)-like protein